MSKPDVIIVTGASSGIGRATALRLAADGWHVVAASRRAAPLAALEQENPRIHPFPLDVDQPQAGVLLARAAREVGRLRGVVHSAGAFSRDPVQKIHFSDWHAMFTTNVEAAARILQATVDDLADGGVFIGIGSTAGLRPVAGSSAYCASKAALTAFLQSAALELAPRGIRIHVVAPGIVETPMVPYAAETGAMHPLGRPGKPEEVAHAVSFLLTPQAAWMTGVVLPVDGGISLT